MWAGVLSQGTLASLPFPPAEGLRNTGGGIPVAEVCMQLRLGELAAVAAWACASCLLDAVPRPF